MGRQTSFFMLPPDALSFLDFVLSDQQNVLLNSRSNSSSPQSFFIDQKSISSIFGNVDKLLTVLIWNKGFPSWLKHLRKLELRKYDGNSYSYIRTGEVIYSIDVINAHVIEFTPSFINSSGSLTKGRIWAEMYSVENEELVYKGIKFEKWYDAMSQWIRRNFRKIKGIDGYWGPAAYELYEQERIPFQH